MGSPAGRASRSAEIVPQAPPNGPPEADMPEQRLPIIGTGSQTTPTEAVLRAGLDAAGLDVVVEHWEPRPHQLGATIAKLREREYLGALVIAPHKEKATTLVA